MRVKIVKGIEAAGKFPFGHMSEENAIFLCSNVGVEFDAIRASINGYELAHRLLSGKRAKVHIYNAIEVEKGE